MSLSTTACRFHSPAVTIRRSGAAASPAVARPAPGLTRPARDVARFAWGKDEKGEEGKIYIQGEFVVSSLARHFVGRHFVVYCAKFVSCLGRL